MGVRALTLPGPSRAIVESPHYKWWAYFRNDEMDRARIYAEKAREIDPNNAMVQQILAAL